MIRCGRLAQLGIVFQQPTLDLELTVTANLMFHAGLHGMPRAVAQAFIDKEVARVSLADRAGDKTSEAERRTGGGSSSPVR